MASRRIVFFGGQGSRSLSSSRPHLPLDGQNGSFTISLLLSTCYTAFLQEFRRSQSIDPVPVWARLSPPSNPEDLLSVPSTDSHSPIFHGICLCVNQLVGYLQNDITLEVQAHSTPAGFCSGMLPAIVLASSETVEEFVRFSGEAVRLAFWIGYRAAEISQTIAGDDWQKLPWTLSVFGMDKESIEKAVQDFNESGLETSPLRVASRIGSASFTIVGPGSALELLRSQYLTGKATSEPVLVHALYHGGKQAFPALTKVVADAERARIDFPSWAALKRPIWSFHDASLIDSTNHPDTSLLEFTLGLIMVDTADLYETWNSIRDTIESSHGDWDIITVGPGSNALLALLYRDIPRPQRTRWIDIPSVVRENSPPESEGFAIVGMSVEFPLGDGKEAFWEMLEQGMNAAQEIPGTRFQVEDYKAGSPHCRPTREMKARHGNFLKNPFEFDHEYFGISPREAKSMDPQQKVLLQRAVHAMDDAGYVPNGSPTFDPKTIACYIGVATEDYVQNLAREVDVYYSTGTLRAFLSGKISYAYGWSGPSIVVDTACSSSLVSVVMACRALAQGDCTTALAGGVNAITSPDMYLGLSRAHFLSQTGQCKPFDVSADGYCRAEGCGLFVIKRLKDAVREGDRIYGVIKGSEINQSGNASSITHPDSETQKQLFRKLLTSAKVDGKTISVIEAHGTGTQAGDAVEASSIESTFGGFSNPVYLTSVKGNIGHAEAASGSAGLAKLLMMLRTSKIPPQVGCSTLNPKLEGLARRNIRIPTSVHEWNRIAPNLPRRALLNNFGAAGSNAALILEEYLPPSVPRGLRHSHRDSHNLVLSARSSTALRELVDGYLKLLQANGTEINVQSLCYTATTRRQRHKYVLSVVGGTIAELVEELQRQPLLDIQPVDYRTKYPVVFVFSGQGSFYSGMGQQLLHTAPVFNDAVVECDRLLAQNGFSEIIPRKALDGTFSPTCERDWVLWSQVSCFALEYALASLWISWNVQPDIVIGHSLGEYVAMVISGALSLESALVLVARRAQLMATMCEIGKSTMLACNLSVSSVESIIADCCLSKLTVACDNSVADTVVSGPVDQIAQLAEVLKDKGVRCKRLDVPLGFHSSALDPMLDAFEDICKTLSFATPRIPLGSCLHGRLIDDGDLNQSYPVFQTRGVVRFTEMVSTLMNQDQLHKATFIEVGPCPITLPMVRSRFSGQQALFLPSLVKGQDPWTSMCRALQQISMRYDSLEWRGVFNGCDARVVDLPEYPFQKQALYIPFKEPLVEQANLESVVQTKPSMFHLLQETVTSRGTEPSVFCTTLETLSEYIQGHSVGGFPLCPASVYHAMVLEGMHYQPGSIKDQVAVVSDIEFGHPLVYSPETKSKAVHLALEGSFPKARDGRFAFTTTAASGTETTLCSGRIGWKSYADTAYYLTRKAAFAQKQMKLLRRNKNQTNTLHRNVIYNIIFPRVVDYAEPYRSITSLNVDEAELDGYGTFEVPASALKGGVVSPVFIDTLLHAAGFVANSHARPSDAFICSKVESTAILYTDISPKDTFNIYCSLLECGDERLGDAFAMTLDGKAVASIEGMHFKRLNLKSFTNHLSRQVGQKHTDYFSRPLATQVTPSPKKVPVSMPSIPDPTGAVVSLITKFCEQPPGAVTSDKRLAELGIDSLMQIELASSLRGMFPHLNTAGLTSLETVGDIQKYIIKSGSPSNVTSLNESSNKTSSEESDDNSSTISSGNLTPSTEMTVPNDMTDILLQLVAETCGFEPSDVRPDMTLESLGMDSLMAIEFQEGLRNVMGKSLPQETFPPGLTIRELALMLESSRTNSPSSQGTDLATRDLTDITSSSYPVSEKCIVHLQQGNDSLPPLIVFHDGSGMVEKYRRLGKVGCDVFGVRNPDLTDRAHWAGSLGDMAGRYAESIVSVIKRKEVVLGGWSFGGVLAHEVAQRLEPKGYTTLAVLLIDSPCPLNHQPLPPQVVDYILRPKQLPQSVRDTMSFQFQVHAQFLAEHQMKCLIPPRRKYTMLHSQELLDTTRLCGVAYPWLESREHRLAALRQWEELLGRSLAVHDIPGNHFEPFNDGYVDTVSQTLRTVYEKVAGNA